MFRPPPVWYPVIRWGTFLSLVYVGVISFTEEKFMHVMQYYYSLDRGWWWEMHGFIRKCSINLTIRGLAVCLPPYIYFQVLAWVSFCKSWLVLKLKFILFTIRWRWCETFLLENHWPGLERCLSFCFHSKITPRNKRAFHVATTQDFQRGVRDTKGSSRV